MYGAVRSNSIALDLEFELNALVYTYTVDHMQIPLRLAQDLVARNYSVSRGRPVYTHRT